MYKKSINVKTYPNYTRDIPTLPRSNNSADVLMDSLKKCLEFYKENKHSKSDEILAYFGRE